MAAVMTNRPRFSGAKSSAELKAELLGEMTPPPANDAAPTNDAPPPPPIPEAPPTQEPPNVVPFVPPSQRQPEAPPPPPPPAAAELTMPPVPQAPTLSDTRYEDELRRIREEHNAMLAAERARVEEERKAVQAQAAAIAAREAELDRLKQEREIEEALALQKLPEVAGYSEEEVRSLYDQLVKPAVKALAVKSELENKKLREQIEKGGYVTEEKMGSLLEARARADKRTSAHNKVLKTHPDFPALKESNQQLWADLIMQPIRTAEGLATTRTYNDEIISALERGSEQDVEFISGIVKVFKSRLGVGVVDDAPAKLVEPAPVAAQTATIPATAPTKEEVFTWDDITAMDIEYREGRISKEQRDDFLKRFDAAKAAGRVKL